MMKPRVVYQVVDGENVITSNPSALGHPISAQTANLVTEMMVATVEEGLDDQARVPGYTVAGQTGTAQIWGVVDYLPDDFIMSFVGFLPADDPQISILVMLDRPTSGRWASQVTAPVFARLAGRLVTLLQIPNDEVRRQLEAQGVELSAVQP
jgi:cell division protein FtsI/penicillin-binding protein 2